jgi:hypothetical protein
MAKVNPEDIHKRPEWLKKYYWIACHHPEKPFDIQCWISFDCRSCQIYAEAAILRKEGQEFKMVSYDDDGLETPTNYSLEQYFWKIVDDDQFDIQPIRLQRKRACK